MKKKIFFLVVSLLIVFSFYYTIQIIYQQANQPIPDSIVVKLQPEGGTYVLGTFTEGTSDGIPYSSAGQIFTVKSKVLNSSSKVDFIMTNETGEKLFTHSIKEGEFIFTVPHGNWSFYTINNNQKTVDVSIKIDVQLS